MIAAYKWWQAIGGGILIAGIIAMLFNVKDYITDKRKNDALHDDS